MLLLLRTLQSCGQVQQYLVTHWQSVRVALCVPQSGEWTPSVGSLSVRFPPKIDKYKQFSTEQEEF